MSTYYVSPYGSDSNAGTSASSSGAWLTITKALGASGVAVGDTLYICPGTYYEQVTPNKAPASEGERITVIGDINNVSGFTDGSSAKVPRRDVILQGRSAGKWADSASGNCFTLASKSYYTFKNLTCAAYENGYAWSITGTTVATKILDCKAITRSYCINVGVNANVADATEILRCALFSASNYTLFLNYSAPTSADLNTGTVVKDSLLVSSSESLRLTCAAGTYFCGGTTVSNCTFVGTLGIRTATNTNTNPTYPVNVDNCLFITSTAEQAAANGQIKETGGCYLMTSATARTNLAAGDVSPNSVVSGSSASPIALEMSLPALAPLVDSPQAGWYSGTPTTSDILGRIRPSTGGTSNTATSSGTATSGTASTLTDSGKSWTVNAYTGQIVRITSGTGSGQWRFIASNTSTALTVAPDFTTTPDATSVYEVIPRAGTGCVGCYEVHDQDRKEATTTDSGNGIVISGPGDTEFLIPVDNASTTISVKARYDSTHAATNKPQAQLVENGEIGFSGETKTMTSAADTWETLTFTAFTPSQKGVVKLRLISRSASGAGKAFFDTVSIT